MEKPLEASPLQLCLALPAPLAFLAFLPLSLAALPPLPPSFAAFFFLGGIEEVRTQGFEPPLCTRAAESRLAEPIWETPPLLSKEMEFGLDKSLCGYQIVATNS